MKIILSAITLFACASTLSAAAAGEDARKVIDEVTALYARVPGFHAEVETRHKTADDEIIATRSLTVSKQHGWKVVDGEGDNRRQIINDFKTNYEYFPAGKKVVKLSADLPEIAGAFQKPATDINPVTALSSESIQLLGTEEFQGEPVYHLKGTTTTRLMMRGKPVNIEIEAWISRNDGIPRKTVERCEDRVGTTVYRNLTVRRDLSADDFQFRKPADVEEIDMNAEMRAEEGAARPPEPSQNK